MTQTASSRSTPKEAGYYFPAEFSPHEATWLSWPHKETSWPGKIEAILPLVLPVHKNTIGGGAGMHQRE